MTRLDHRRVAISQSNYIPWKGYFDMINMVDEFILFDTAQYTRRDWRNRNRIKTPTGSAWLTIPVVVKGRYWQTVQDTEIEDPAWRQSHWRTLVHNYRRAPYFDAYHNRLEDLYLGCEDNLLSRINYRFLTAICEMLAIKTRFTWSKDYPQIEGKTQRLVEWCKIQHASEYLSGPAAKGYLEENLFTEAGIAVRYLDYSGYPEYRQLYPPFDHAVSILDLILSAGPNSANYMKSFLPHARVLES